VVQVAVAFLTLVDFFSVSLSFRLLDDLMFVPHSFKKQAISAALSGPSSSSHATPIAAPSCAVIPGPPSSHSNLPSYHHQLFTYDQVASIVRNAVERREEQIREEYNKTLQEMLREQVSGDGEKRERMRGCENLSEC
jgi:hypothetical protein